MRRIIIGVALTAITLVAGMIGAPARSDAHIVPGEYSIYMREPQYQLTSYNAAIGQTIDVVFGAEHGFGMPACTGAAGVPGCYQAADFQMLIDSAIITTSTSAVFRDPAAPNFCTAEFYSVVTGTIRKVVVGCVSLAGASANYSGPFWHVPLTCVGPGVQTLTFHDTPTGTFIHDGASEQPQHLHDGVSITCVDLPAAGDADGDTCTNAQELGPNPVLGGDRDPNEIWDFYDVTGHKVVDLQDTLLVLAHFGHGYNGGAYQDPMDNALDRSTPSMTKPWRSAEANDGLDTRDALASLKSFGHSCVMMP